MIIYNTTFRILSKDGGTHINRTPSIPEWPSYSWITWITIDKGPSLPLTGWRYDSGISKYFGKNIGGSFVNDR